MNTPVVEAWSWAALGAAVRSTPIAELPKVMGVLAEAEAIGQRRLVTELSAEPGPTPEPDELLTRDEVAAYLRVKPEQVHRISALRPHRRTLGRKTIRYIAAGVRRVAQRRAA